jgi:hypothetical protein
LREQFRLPPLGARVGRFRIERRAQQPFAFGERGGEPLRPLANVRVRP